MGTISKSIKTLVNDLPFYGLLVLNLKATPFKSKKGYMGVGKDPENPTAVKLYYNEEALAELSQEEVNFVLLHELFHITYGHVFSEKAKVNQELHNIATDCFINSDLVHNTVPTLNTPSDYRLARGGIMPSRYGLPDKQTSQFYWDALYKMNQSIKLKCNLNCKNGNSNGQNQQSQDNSCQGESEGDQTGSQNSGQVPGNNGNQQSNSGGGGSPGGNGLTQGEQNLKDDLEMLKKGNGNSHQWDMKGLNESERKRLADHVKRNIANIGREIIERYPKGSDGQGHVPGHVKSYIDELFRIKVPELNWKSFVKRFISTRLDITRKNTRRRDSKRFPGNPGKRLRTKKRILYAIDTSGSMGQDDLSDSFSEVHNIWKAGVAVDITECDTEINNVYPYEGVTPKFITGRGGTAITPVIEYFNAHIKDYVALVILTDGYHEHPNIRVNKPVLQLITSREHDESMYQDMPYTTLIMKN